MSRRETWRTIGDYPNYDVSDKGHVRNNKTDHVLKPGIKNNGYPVVVLSNESGRCTKHVHKLVADAFYDHEDRSLVVNHKDGNKRNNAIGNLELVTSSENNRHAYRTGLKRPTPPPKFCRRIRIVETGEEFDSIRDCAARINGNHRHISDCLNGKLKTHRKLHFEEI